MNIKQCPSFSLTIHIAGDHKVAEQICREFCMKGLCVTVTPTKYIYTGGAEDGAMIGLINYPRFPKTFDELTDLAKELGSILMDRLCQLSFTVVGPQTTIWYCSEKKNA